MTGLRPSLGWVALLTALAVPAPAAVPPAVAPLAPALAFPVAFPVASPVQDDLRRTFDEGVALMRAGKDEEALAVFQRVLAQDPGSEEAYRLWQQTDENVWLELLVKQGEFELVAKHFMGRSSSAIVARQNDADAIRALLTKLPKADAIERRTIVQTLAAQHGEYAVPYMLAALADRADDDRRVLTIQALTRFRGDAVPPLLEALESPDAFLRQNVAYTLGYIGDHRATGMLLRLAADDAEPAVRAAADRALAEMGAVREGSAAETLVREGDDYLARRDNVLAPALWSEVVWHLDGGRLVAHPVARLVFPEEMAKQSYYRALAAEPAHAPALAGIARASARALARLEDVAATGADDGEVPDVARSGKLASLTAGPAALDDALAASLELGDEAGARALVRMIGESALRPTDALHAALGADSAAVSEEAALALTRLSLASGEPVAADVVARLARAAGREILQAALVIDPDAQRAETLVSALRGRGMMVHHAATGATGLASLMRLPRLDAVFVAERLPDLTASQVITEIERHPVQSRAPRLLIAADAAAAEELYGERLHGYVGADLDLAPLDEAMEAELGRDRQLADDLSARSARALLDLARAGVDVTSARDGLLGVLSGRPDPVTLPALEVLGRIALPADGAAIAAVVTDGARSAEVRTAAALALAGLFVREPRSADAGALTTLGDLLRSEEPLELRIAVANALGQLDLDPALRASLMRDVRIHLGASQ